jgi:CYTH domain-containing protein/predicted ATPase
MQCVKIVLTGGPCAGKTTALSTIQGYFTKIGWKVVILDEEVTSLITSGIFPPDFTDPVQFQQLLAEQQIQKEQNYEHYLAKTTHEKIMFVCDRGLCDSHAYITDEQYNQLLQNLGLTATAARDRYDAVFHMVTAADGAVEFYTLGNNVARSESPELAIELDHRTQNAWVGHPHLRIIKNGVSFEQKLNNLLAEISTFLGEPLPYEIERKFLIEYPNLISLLGMQNCQCVDILQTYLLSAPDEEIRVRQRGLDGSYTFTKTTKRNTDDPAKRIEVEQRISRDTYLKLLMQADPERHPIRKTRYCILQRDSGQYLEIDIYPGNTKHAIMEVELSDANTEIVVPDFIHIIREVTDDSRYKNYQLAKNAGKLPED